MHDKYRSASKPTEPNRRWLREELLHLLSLSGTLAGLCITGITLLHSVGSATIVATFADDGLALSSVLFLVCTYTTFIALRTKNQELAYRLEVFVDILLSLALTCMVLAGLVLVYAVW